MFRRIQCTNNYHSVAELTCTPNDVVTDIRKVPPLAKIAAQFLSGRPIDSSLNRTIPYNDIEDNPLLRKGVDLADLSDIAEEVGMKLSEANDAVEKAKVAKTIKKESQIANPATTPPESVSTE